ncbi:MAG: response regulator [Coriobacteriales bacterium]|jgi:signal transduction histidine kinase|nr:response regulator [Coriobacteriales bacterium]
MIVRFRDFLIRYLISDETPLEGRIFNITMCLCTVGAVFGTLVTTVQLSSMISVILTLMLTAGIAVFTVICNRTRNYATGSLIICVLAGCVVFPFVYFSSGGISSGMLAYFLLGTVAISVLLQGARFYIVITLYIFICLGCYLINYLFPETVTTIGTESMVYMDVAASFTIASLLVAFTIKSQNLQFLKAQRSAEVERQRAESAAGVKSDFLSNMSHEMRTPMNAIIGMTTVGLASDDIAVKDKSLDQVHLASKHLLGIINDILDMSKIESGKLELSQVAFEFRQMIANVTNMVTHQTREQSQNFFVKIDPDIPTVLVGDDQRLAQVLANLLSNAVKFTPEHGTITLETVLAEPPSSASPIDDEAETSPDDRVVLRFEVQDDGIGMDVGQQTKLFNAFTQVDSSTSRRYGGTGLGLAISKRIVELMDGTIWVESSPEQGSRFSFTVTLAKAPAEQTALLAEAVPTMTVDTWVDATDKRILNPQTAPVASIVSSPTERDTSTADTLGADILTADAGPPEESPRKSGAGSAHKTRQPDFSNHTILLVEDLEINREIVLALLEPTRIQIETAANGIEAIWAFKDNYQRYEMIFMDIQMPEMDGLEATRQIRALAAEIPRAQSIPIVAMTANVFKEDVEKSREAGMNDHIGKPLDLGELIGLLKKYLGVDKHV